jgi:hypothetical protein
MIQPEELSIPVLKLEGDILTSSSGFDKLIKLYYDAAQFTNTEITLDCYDLNWIDANLASFLSAIEYRLVKENKVSFRGDYEFFSKKFGVLFRNGWLKPEEGIVINDVQNTTLPCRYFLPNQEREFCEYINEHLLVHRGMPEIIESKRKKIESDLIEIRNNIFQHANTEDPFFVCGQFFPKLEYLIFTMVDLGVGFLKPINEFTEGAITTTKDAIVWALNGNSITGNKLAGLGLQGICEYMNSNKGTLQICSGNVLWATDLEASVLGPDRILRQEFKGSVLSLWFKYVK